MLGIVFRVKLHEAIEIALATGFRVYGHQEGVNKEDILEYVKKVLSDCEQIASYSHMFYYA